MYTFNILGSGMYAHVYRMCPSILLYLLLYSIIGMVLLRISHACSSAKVYFTDTGNMHCMPQGHAMHVPSVSEIYLVSGPCIINPGENYYWWTSLGTFCGVCIVLLSKQLSWAHNMYIELKFLLCAAVVTF